MEPLFSLTIVIPVAIVYGLIGLVLLALFRKRITIVSLSAFIGSGAVSGIISMILYGRIFADDFDHLNSQSEDIGMFIMAGVSAILGSLLAIQLTANKQ